jgi:hypothetical protein
VPALFVAVTVRYMRAVSQTVNCNRTSGWTCT